VPASDDLHGAAGVSMRGALEDTDAADERAVAAEADEADEANRVSLRDRVPAGAQPPLEPGDESWDFETPPMIARYLKGDESRVIALRLHTIRLAAPALAAVGGLALAAALNGWAYSAGHATPALVRPIWFAWLAGLAWSAWRWLEWRQTWFVITGHRLMVVQARHLLGREVTMLPIPKLRDVAYRQTALGRTAGYATLDFASIGTERALDLVKYVPHPEWVYQRIAELVMPDPDRRTVRRTGPKLGEG